MNELALQDAIASVRESEKRCEYEFLSSIYIMARLHGSQLLLSEVNALSGYPFGFLYDYAFPEVFNSQPEQIVENLREYAGIWLDKASIDSFQRLMEVITDVGVVVVHPSNHLIVMIDQGEARYVKGYFEHDLANLEKGEAIGNAYFIKKPILTSRNEIYELEKFKKILVLAYKNFSLPAREISGKIVSSGKAALESFADDLRNPERDFQGESKRWFQEALKSQWTSLYGFYSYFLGIFHFLKSEVQDACIPAIKSLEDSVMYFRDFNRVIGTKSFIPQSSVIPMEIRRRATNSLERAKGSLERTFSILLSAIMGGSQ